MDKMKKLKLIYALAASLLLSACDTELVEGEGIGNNGSPNENRTPVAQIDASSSVSLGSILVLSASGSGDPDYADNIDNLTYLWSIDSDAVTLKSTNSVNTEAVVSDSANAGSTIEVSLTVTDSNGNVHSSSKTVILTEEDNLPPVVNIESVSEQNDFTQFTSVSSFDPEERPLTRHWRLYSDNGELLKESSTEIFDTELNQSCIAANYTLQLSVSDEIGQTVIETKEINLAADFSGVTGHISLSQNNQILASELNSEGSSFRDEITLSVSPAICLSQVELVNSVGQLHVIARDSEQGQVLYGFSYLVPHTLIDQSIEINYSAVNANNVEFAAAQQTVELTDSLGFIADSQLLQCINDHLLENEAWQVVTDIVALDCQSYGITSLAGIELLTSLASLSLANTDENSATLNKISDISYLSPLNNLSSVDIANNPVCSIDALSDKNKLTKLNLSGLEQALCRESEISCENIACAADDGFIKGQNDTFFQTINTLENLNDLDVSANHIYKLDFLDGVSLMNSYNLANNNISLLNPLIQALSSEDDILSKNIQIDLKGNEKLACKDIEYLNGLSTGDILFEQCIRLYGRDGEMRISLEWDTEIAEIELPLIVFDPNGLLAFDTINDQKCADIIGTVDNYICPEFFGAVGLTKFESLISPFTQDSHTGQKTLRQSILDESCEQAKCYLNRENAYWLETPPEGDYAIILNNASDTPVNYRLRIYMGDKLISSMADYGPELSIDGGSDSVSFSIINGEVNNLLFNSTKLALF